MKLNVLLYFVPFLTYTQQLITSLYRTSYQLETNLSELIRNGSISKVSVEIYSNFVELIHRSLLLK